MKIGILRRRGLGATSCKGIVRNLTHHDGVIIRNDKPQEELDILVRWGTTSNYPSARRTLNKAEAIRAVNDKPSARLVMMEAGVMVPKTWLSVEEIESWPVIARPKHHSQGKKLWVCHSREEAQGLEGDLYFSEYIRKEEEFGVFIFDNRVTSMIQKVPKTQEAADAIAWNVAQGTHKFVNLRWEQWNLPAAIEALKAARAFPDLTFGRVDVISKNGQPYVLEVNSAHSLTSPYRQQTFAKTLEWTADNGGVENTLDLSSARTYKYIIHPALRVNGSGINL